MTTMFFRICVPAMLIAASVGSAEAGPLRGLFGRSTCSRGGCDSAVAPATIDLPPGITDVSSRTSSPVDVSATTVAQAKAETIAARGVLYHPGGSFAGGSHEGVGFSTVSADDAVKRCCFWGQRTPIGIGVARGVRGWFACVLYR